MDTTELSLDQVVECVVTLVEKAASEKEQRAGQGGPAGTANEKAGQISQ